MKYFIMFSLIGLCFFTSCDTSIEEKVEKEDYKITENNITKKAEDLEWTPLNPARGDASPQAANVWGDRSEAGATGFLVKFKEGFSSPPHIHNVTYKGIVLEGLVHNDDEHAAKMWMDATSFWTQPAGEPHITSATSAINLAYIEIEQGPYLVHATEASFDNGERPINVHSTNLVWVPLQRFQESQSDFDNVQIAHLWGKPSSDGWSGQYIKLPKGFTGKLVSEANDFHAIVVKGKVAYSRYGSESEDFLGVGSYFGALNPSVHKVQVAEETIIYLRTNGHFKLINP